MKIIRHLQNTAIFAKGSALTIGNFDAVHLGHQSIIKKLNDAAVQRGLTSVLMTFFPNPRNYFLPDDERSPRLTTLTDRYFALQPLGLDAIYVAKFDAELAATSAHDFVQHYLCDCLNAKYILVGDDFRFGTKRTGDFQLLKKMGEEKSFEVEQLPSIVHDEERVSSSRIRSLLKVGELKQAAALLGRPYTISSRVVHGDKRGRQLGFPTMNLPIRTLVPLSGVYLVSIKGLEKNQLDKIYWGVANVGMRPTVDGKKQLLEVHAFDFSEHVYGQRICVEFHERLRDEKKFPTLQDLAQQIDRDVVMAKRKLKQYI